MTGGSIQAPAPEPNGTPDTEHVTRARRRWMREARLRRNRNRTLVVALPLLCAAALVTLALLLALAEAEPEPVSRVQSPAVGGQPEPPAPASESAPVPVADLEPEWRRIVSRHTGFYGAVAFDPGSGQTVAINADESFYAASLAKLLVLITLYEQAAAGALDLEEEISILSQDVQAYGTGVLYLEYPIGHTMTLRECAEYMMKESDNTAWYMLERRLGREAIAAQAAAIGAADTDYITTFTTTPDDVLLMLQKIADPEFTSEALSEEMLAAMTDTAYEDRLPASLPEDARVAHKIGSYGDMFADAGVVFYGDAQNPEDHYFVVVVGQTTNEDDARSAIQEMSRAAYETFAEPRLR